MTLSVKTDDSWPGGGFALLGAQGLDGEGLDGVTAVTVESCLSKQLLNAQGQWGKFPHLFPVAQTPSGALLLGPDIVDHVPTELFILLRDQTGRELGKIFWVDVMPSRDAGATPLADVLAVHQRGVFAEAPKREPQAPPAVVAPPPPEPPVTPLPPPPPVQPPNDPPPLPPPPPPKAAEPAPAPPPPSARTEADPPKVPPPRPVDRSTPAPPPPLPAPNADVVTVVAAPEVAARVLPFWLTITLVCVFSSSLLLVLSMLMGVV